MTYRHTQTGRLTLVMFAVLIVVFVFVAAGSDVTATALAGLLVFLVALGGVLSMFTRLTVEVGDTAVSARFSWGWPRRTIALDDIVQVSAVRNRWWYGFGVRITPHGWLYNVWGLDAVHLDLRDGSSFRIGTDEPGALATAIRQSAPRI
ncbi:MAG: hypothetical protein ACFCVK_13895 [Acidimicrobiales bacterium]